MSRKIISLMMVITGCLTIATAQSETDKRGTIFEDDFESGNTDNWDTVVPGRPFCDCYFSSDCGGLFCDYGPGSFSTEDICEWATPKPNMVVGFGCTVIFPSTVWSANICDGTCKNTREGSALGWEAPELISQGIQLWAEAIMTPCLQGGGPIDPTLAQQALNLPFKQEGTSIIVGRHTADIFIMAGGIEFYHYYCHFEAGDPDPSYWVDLTGSPEVVDASINLVQSILAEMDSPGSGQYYIDQIQQNCPNWQTLFPQHCPFGENTLECVYARITKLCEFLLTPANYLVDLEKGGDE